MPRKIKKLRVAHLNVFILTSTKTDGNKTLFCYIYSIVPVDLFFKGDYYVRKKNIKIRAYILHIWLRYHA